MGSNGESTELFSNFAIGVEIQSKLFSSQIYPKSILQTFLTCKGNIFAINTLDYISTPIGV